MAGGPPRDGGSSQDAPGFRALRYLTSTMSALGAFFILVIMAVILTDVVGRYVFNAPLVGTPEVVAMSITSIVFLQYPSTLGAGRAISATILIDAIGRRSPRTKEAMQTVFYLAGAAFFVTLVWFLAPLIGKSYETQSFYGIPGRFVFPKWPLFTIITFSSAIAAVQYLALAIFAARKVATGEFAPPPPPSDTAFS